MGETVISVVRSKEGADGYSIEVNGSVGELIDLTVAILSDMVTNYDGEQQEWLRFLILQNMFEAFGDEELIEGLK